MTKQCIIEIHQNNKFDRVKFDFDHNVKFNEMQTIIDDYMSFHYNDMWRLNVEKLQFNFEK